MIVYQTDNATLYRGDALAVLRELPDASVDAVITDPPYSSGGAMRSDRMAGTSLKYVQTTATPPMEVTTQPTLTRGNQ